VRLFAAKETVNFGLSWRGSSFVNGGCADCNDIRSFLVVVQSILAAKVYQSIYVTEHLAMRLTQSDTRQRYPQRQLGPKPGGDETPRTSKRLRIEAG
jgi:hypothetical protein